MEKKTGKIVRLGVHSESAASQAAKIEECLNNFGAIIELLDREVEHHPNAAVMAYLVTDADRNFRLLDSLLNMRSTTVAG